MDTAGFINPKLGSDSQDSDDVQPPGPPGLERPLIKFATKDTKLQKVSPLTPLGVEQAKKRLRAFSIQKKASLSPVPIAKGSGTATVFIGKASGVKAVPKPAPEPNQDDPKKPPKPPKPGGATTESYIKTQKKTLAEIEDMKRKMELVELGIPLGLICPAPDSEYNKAMPTKAMPPIKTFLDEACKENAPLTHLKRRPQFVTIHRDKVDELIREGKKARAEGKEFKFDYRKLLPDYDNPFQRKKDLQMMSEPELPKSEPERKSRDKDKSRSDRYDSKRRSSHKSDDKHRRRDDKYKDKSKYKNSSKERDKSKDKKNIDSKHKDQDEKHKERDAKHVEKNVKSKALDKTKDDKKNKEADVKTEETTKEPEKEAEVNLKDFVVCDSWSDNDEKSKDSTPKPEEVKVAEKSPLYAELDVAIDPMKQLRENLLKKEKTSSPKPKLKRLNPDAVKFEVVEPDDDDDDVFDMFDESSSLEKFSQNKPKKEPEESSMDQLFDFDDAKDETFEGMADDTFLESVINEIKQEEIDENSHDKGLVEYDESPSREASINRDSVTPEMDDRRRHLQSSRSDYSDSYKSTESGYKSTESVKMSDCDLETIVEERKRELERMELSRKLDKYTADSLDMWSFVLKVCQPMLFRHDRNKCYKETRIAPKLWYTENPKLCNCVKDRSVVYEELDVYKIKCLDKLYDSEQSPEMVEPISRFWYPTQQQWPTPPVQAASEWEAEDSQAEQQAATPQHDHMLDEEYQRFMATVRPDIGETKSETPRSTPSRQEFSKKKSSEPLEDKSSKRMKMTSEGWSQESEQEEERDKSYPALEDYMFEAVHFTPKLQTVEKKVKEKRKRKHSTSTSMTDSSESEPKKRKKAPKKKDTKKSKLKESKRRRVSKKNIKKLKEKQKKKKKAAKVDDDSDVQELEKEKNKKLKKKKLLKQKKKTQKKKKSRARSSSSDSSDSETEKKSKKKKKGDKKKKKKKSEAPEKQLFDVNVLNNIKTERNSEEERNEMEFSPRKQKVTREIINVKELQSDFVGNSIQIKKEVEEDEKRKVSEKREDSEESQVANAQKDNLEFKEEEESQSTPQLRPDESNNSQCSSQESVYSLKDQPVYEKDESHLRPSSQNSNYSFHDVMASGKFSKTKQAEQEKVYGFENDSRSQESDRLHEQDVRSQACEVRSLEHELRSQEYESRSPERDRSREHDSRRQSEIRQEQSYEYDGHSQEYEIHGIPRHIRDIPRPDSRSRDHDSRSHDHGPRNHDCDPRSHDRDPRSHDRDPRNHDRDPRSHNCDPRSHDRDPRSLDCDPRTHDRDPRIHNRDLRSHDCDPKSHDRDLRSHKHEPDSRSHENDSRNYEHESRSREVINNEHKIHHDMPYKHDMSSHDSDLQTHDVQTHVEVMDNHGYEQGNYEMYEQMAMAYQSDVANQHTSPPDGGSSRPIETVVRARTCGEIKCDWRAGAPLAPPCSPNRPSRWGLKPGEVNIVLTGGSQSPTARVYRIQSLANRTDTGPNTGYDEAYMDTYGAADKLQYGDCFSTESTERRNITLVSSSLDDRINLALRTTVLGEVAKNAEVTEEKEDCEKGILVTKSLAVESRAPKRVSFADGYKPGQDSDVEEPPVKKKKKPRRLGCAWPCPATHPDHVPLWDALPPPPPPPGSPPPPTPVASLPTHLLRQGRPLPNLLQAPPHHIFGSNVKMESLDEQRKFDPSSMPAFMPPEPPPGMVVFPNM